MAKKGRIERNKRILKTVEKESPKRESLISVLKDQTKSYDEKFVVMMALQKLKRDGSATRYRNRCAVTGRSRAYYSKFGLSRNVIRHYASFGLISGLKKSSW